MCGRSQRAKTVRRLIVGGLLVAFCLILFGQSTFASRYPWGNTPRDPSRVTQEVDDGGWAGGASVRTEPITKRHSFFAGLTLWLRGVGVLQYPIVLPKPPNGNENDRQETVPSGTGGTTSTE